MEGFRTELQLKKIQGVEQNIYFFVLTPNNQQFIEACKILGKWAE